EPCGERESRALLFPQFTIFGRDPVITNVRRAKSRSLVHSPSPADQIRRLSLWLEHGPSLRDATSVSC
ncbi:hypothetical protein, partial [Roseiconus lacunae]|uniref:hypothetical protein n=1 Tax=Roseiconus lacunae TaxID=2605694 RepID=UPI001F166A05